MTLKDLDWVGLAETSSNNFRTKICWYVISYDNIRLLHAYWFWNQFVGNCLAACCFYDMGAYQEQFNVPYGADSPRPWIEKDGILGFTGNDEPVDIGQRISYGETVHSPCVMLWVVWWHEITSINNLTSLCTLRVLLISTHALYIYSTCTEGGNFDVEEIQPCIGRYTI